MGSFFLERIEKEEKARENAENDLPCACHCVLLQFKSMVQGTPAWHEKYNGDVGLIFPKTASYAGGVFTVQELPAYDSESSPAQFPLSFAAPAAFTRGDRLRVWSKDIELLDSGLKPLKNAAFKAEAIVALNVDYPAGRAILVAGGTGAVESFTPSDLPTDPPGNVLSFKATAGNKFVILTWMDPADSSYTTWAGTMIRRKLGGYPTDETDGELVVDSKIRNQYQPQGFLDEGLSNTETYFYQAFPYSTANVYNRSEANRCEPCEIRKWSRRREHRRLCRQSTLFHGRDKHTRNLYQRDHILRKCVVG